MRRKAMFALIGTAVVMLFLGSWLFSDAWARAHPWLYLLYWAACAWLTVAGVLLAVLDMLVLRSAARATRRRLEQEFADRHLKGDDQ
jgi:hypothetical protein